MKTAFSEINLEQYLETKRARTAEKELLSGKRYVNERQEIIQGFVDRINKERKGTKFAPVTWPQINGQLRYYRYVDQLKRLYRECDGGRCFSSLFFWKLKQNRSAQK